MILQILAHTPVWVWALLAGLLALGLWQRRERRVRRGQLLLLPLALVALGLWSMAPGFVAQPVAALLWLAAIAGAAGLGLRLPRPTAACWLPEEQRLFLPGSWVPMLIILCIFSLRYAAGVGQGLNPQWRGMAEVQWPLALVFGSLSGLFLGRALGLLRLTRPTIAADGPDRSL
jgi:hypothetical protein